MTARLGRVACAAALLAAVAVGCGGKVQTADGTGAISPGDQADAAAGPAPPPLVDAGAPAPLDASPGADTSAPPLPFPYCAAQSGQCSSDVYPEGETCGECSCRCCDYGTLVEECLSSPDCKAYLTCLRLCTDANCTAKCGLPCDTGAEPACYLADCHSWICSHACGKY